MLCRLVKVVLVSFVGLVSFSCNSSKAKCYSPPNEVLERINESMRHHVPDARLENSSMVRSLDHVDTSLIIGEMSILKGDSVSSHFTYGVWLLDEKNGRLSSISGGSRTYSSLEKADTDTEIKYFESGDLKRVRACMNND